MSAPYLIIALVMLVIVLSVVYLQRINREFRGRDRSLGKAGDGSSSTPLVLLSSDTGDGGGDGGGD